MTFKLSLTSWSLPACSLTEAAGISKVLGIGALDVGYFFGPALDRARLLAEPSIGGTERSRLLLGVPFAPRHTYLRLERRWLRRKMLTALEVEEPIEPITHFVSVVRYPVTEAVIVVEFDDSFDALSRLLNRG